MFDDDDDHYYCYYSIMRQRTNYGRTDFKSNIFLASTSVLCFPRCVSVFLVSIAQLLQSETENEIISRLTQ